MAAQLTALGRSRHFSFNHQRSCSLLSPLPLLIRIPSSNHAKMGAIPEADPDEPVETKPFKFVTGKFSPFHQSPESMALKQLMSESMANSDAAGMYLHDFLTCAPTCRPSGMGRLQQLRNGEIDTRHDRRL